MKTLSKFLNTLPKKFAAFALILVAVILPASSIMAASVQIEGSIGVANVTAGDTLYKQAVNASFDQVVKFQVYYHNKENPDSNKVAENLRVKIAIPSQAGLKQDVRATINGDNTNTINSVATVNLNRADANIEYIPGSAVWKHNKGTNDAPNIVEEKISDAVVTSGQGLVLENEKPCYNFDATVTVLARVKVPSVNIDKTVRVKGTTTWSTTNTAKPGETLEYQIAYKNVGNTQQKNVVIRDNLPAKLAYVPGSTYLKNSTNPSAVKYNSDNITSGGIVIGNYAPGAAGYVKFEVKIPQEKDLACGKNEFRNVAVARPEGMNEFINTAITTVNRECVNPETPVYSCDDLQIAVIGTRQIKATVAVTAKNGATFKDITYTFGDNSQNLVTDQKTVNHTYAADGTYTIKAVAGFMVDGKRVTNSSESCTKTVTFKPGEPPVTPPTTPPTSIPNTGAGSTLAIFAGTMLASAAAYRLWMIRKLS